MKSTIQISTRAARPSACVLSMLLLLASACSGGRSALSTEPVGATTNNSTGDSDKSDLPACGSMTKPCDPNNLGGATCSSLGAGQGTLLCDPVTCSYDQSMCTLSSATGGGGLGALLGAFGRNQGGRAAMGQAQGGRGGRGAANSSGRGGTQGRREDDQEAEGGSGGEQSEDGDSDNDDDDEAGSGGEGGQSGVGGEGGQSSDEESSAGAGGETAGAGGEAGQSGAAGEASEAAPAQ